MESLRFISSAALPQNPYQIKKYNLNDGNILIFLANKEHNTMTAYFLIGIVKVDNEQCQTIQYY